MLIAHAGSEISIGQPRFDIDLKPYREIGADVTVVHHPHEYRFSDYEEYGIYVVGDFIFNRPGHLSPNRPSAAVEVNVSGDICTATLTRFGVDEVYAYEKSGS